MKSKVEEILKATFGKQDSKVCTDIFREDLKVICNYRISNIEDYREIILQYADVWCRTQVIATDFINSVTDGSFYTFFEVKYIGRKRYRESNYYIRQKIQVKAFRCYTYF